MLINPEQYSCAYPDNVAVIGGGRWARVLTEVLCDLVPLGVKLSVHSPRNAKMMVAWVSERGLEKRISVSSSLPSFPSDASSAIIVTNAACDHERSVEWALTQGYPVLVEKPLCLSFVAAQRLANLALARKVYLATAHVFLFASYVEEFSKHVADVNKIVSIRVLWMDPQSESRYGEIKSYDPGLPIYADWLPHVISILGTLVIGRDLLCEHLDFLKGGAHLKINLIYGQIPCVIELVRNGNSRQRVIEVITDQKKITLDFGKEPGSIYSEATLLSADQNLTDKPKPVARMLTAFLQGAAGGILDSRLDMSIGLSASHAINQTKFLYNAALLSWLNKELLTKQDGINSDLCYALTELLQAQDNGSSVPLAIRIDYLYRRIKELVMPLNIKPESCTADVIKLIIKQGNISSYL
ncbi:Gfo/Idh/MocA family oxidoreductase [Polynucleobacter necessarius]|uniref:Gfo/Idh/MocA family oxidoreductase n=1 Tax=Polynucleobacter necessarius TaxID=576610 RepID=UPI000E08CF6F|nr:Gfo/Idh/MocA family oxidoreductase [Polynucleobacter necessarius]